MTAVRIHATTVAIGGRGVMMVGPSGSGKSDLALRLIDRGAVLVSDDYTECTAGDRGAIATAPDTIAGQIEVRGIGIVDVPHRRDVLVALVVRLDTAVERMPESLTYQVVGIDVPAIALAPFEASAPIKVEIALSGLVEG